MTSQERKERSSMRGAQREAFQEMSLDIAAQGWLGRGRGGAVNKIIKYVYSSRAHRQRRTTTVSDLAGMKPSINTFLLPQL